MFLPNHIKGEASKMDAKGHYLMDTTLYLSTLTHSIFVALHCYSTSFTTSSRALATVASSAMLPATRAILASVKAY